MTDLTGGVSPYENPTISGFKEGWKSANRIKKLGLIGFAAAGGMTAYKEATQTGFRDPAGSFTRIGAEAVLGGIAGTALSYAGKLRTGLWSAYERNDNSVRSMLSNLIAPEV